MLDIVYRTCIEEVVILLEKILKLIGKCWIYSMEIVGSNTSFDKSFLNT